MRSKLILLFVLVALGLSLNAQTENKKPITIGVGALIGFPVSSAYHLPLGLDVIGEYAVAPSWGLTLSAGYDVGLVKTVYWSSESGYRGVNEGLISVMAGGKYYFANKFYGSAQLGVFIYTAKGSGNYLTFAPGIGYKISKKFDLLLKFQSFAMSDLDFLGIRAGFTF